jgi:acetoacetyl-CoA synthetase
VYAVSDIPRTLNGKRLEVPVKRILTGTPPEKAVSPDAISNPQSIHFFIDLARSLDEARS